MSDVTVGDMQARIEQLKGVVEKADLALKLEKNREFKKLILDGFCLEDCARYAQLSADPSLTEEQRQDAMALSQASGHLRRYLSVTVKMGAQARKDIEEMGQEIETMRAEETHNAADDQVEA